MANTKLHRGPIDPATCYPLADFQRRTGFGDAAMRAARKAGLRVIYVHKRPFILGADFILYLQEAGEVPEVTNSPSVSPGR